MRRAPRLLAARLAPTVAVLAVLLALPWGATPALADTGPRIALDHREFHFGRVTQGKVVTHRFPFSNVGDAELVIDDVSTPCGCTAVLPDKSRLMPGESSYIEVDYDSSARSGEVTRVITVVSNDSVEPELTLEVTASVDASMHEGFESGETLFGPKCGKCHYDPNLDLSGQELYESACWFCHGKWRQGNTAMPLGAYTPDRADYLRHTIANGLPGTEMPGFHRSKGGPLTDAQIDSLLDVLYKQPPEAPVEETKPEATEVPVVGDPSKPFFQ